MGATRTDQHFEIAKNDRPTLFGCRRVRTLVRRINRPITTILVTDFASAAMTHPGVATDRATRARGFGLQTRPVVDTGALVAGSDT